MANMSVGRNDPCPCGSGRKYGECCLWWESIPSPSDRLADFFADMKHAMKGKEFASREEAEAFMDGFVRQRNATPSDDFCGLSPDQMIRLLEAPFDSPDLVTIPACLSASPSAPILTLFELLVEAVGDKGLKPTATGNLPVKFLREAGLAYWGEDGYLEHTELGDIRTEPEFYDMHATRLVAGLAGLIHKYKGKFILSRNCQKLLGKQGLAAVYPRLLRAYVERFNWGYRDGYPDIHFIQHSFLFTLYLFSLYGNEWRPHSFYEDAFLRAFPIVLSEVPPVSHSTPDKIVRDCYSWRCLKDFAGLMGLVEIAPESDKPFEHRFKLRKLPLLDEVVIFHLPAL